MRGKISGKGPIGIFIFLFLLFAGGAVFSYLYCETLSAEIANIESQSVELASVTENWQSGRNLPRKSLFTEEVDSQSDKRFTAPEGFTIVSKSEKWRGERLREIYEELLNNTHGAEIHYLDTVLVLPSEEKEEDYSILGYQQDNRIDKDVFVFIPSIVPKDLGFTIDFTTSTIALFNMDAYDTIEQAAPTISHEYGHHYTSFYFFKEGEKIENSEYYKIRNLHEYPKAKKYIDPTEYRDNYDWDIREMAAEDYVQILGSPNARPTLEYMDIYETLVHKTDTDPKYEIMIEDSFNACPQRNIFIPLASQVPGLYDYYHSFLNNGKTFEAKKSPDIKLNVERKSKYGYKYFTITWNKITDNPDTLYTLVCFTKDGHLYMPVKTVRGNEEASAIVGTASILRGTWLHYYSDNIPKEERFFMVYVLLPDGVMVGTNPIPVKFN